MHKSQYLFALVAGLSMVFVGGCGGKTEGPVSRLPRDTAAEMNAQRSQFDTGKDPEFKAETHYAAGQLAESQEAYGAAIQQYRLALKRDGNHLPSLYRLGVVYSRIKSYPEAIGAWTRYLNVSGGDAAAAANLGYCYELAGRYGEAEAAYQKGLAKSPDNSACRVNYGLMLARAGRTDAAIEQLRVVLTEPQVYYNIGSVYEQQGRRTEAREAYRRALEACPDFPEAQMRLAGLK